jgi:hypothetical protein
MLTIRRVLTAVAITIPLGALLGYSIAGPDDELLMSVGFALEVTLTFWLVLVRIMDATSKRKRKPKLRLVRPTAK